MRDDAGRMAAESDLHDVQVRVASPATSVFSQIMNAIGNGQNVLNMDFDSGHTFLWYPGADGSPSSGIGLYPTTGWFDGFAKINVVGEANHPYTHRMMLRLSTASMLELTKATLRDQIASLGPEGGRLHYSIMDHNFGDKVYNCTTWVVEKLRDIGVVFPDITTPEALEPYTLARKQGFRARWSI